MTYDSTPLPSSTPPPSALHRIFLGSNGIRAGWRLMMFCAIVCGLFALLFGIVALLHLPRTRSRSSISQLKPSLLLVTEGTIFVVTAMAALVMGRIERRRFSQYGLPLTPLLGTAFWKGSGWGLLSISGTLLAIFLLHGFRISGLAIHGTTLLASAAAWVITFVLVGIAEEFAFRGYPQFTLATGIGFWPAAFLLSFLFAWAHQGNRGESGFGVLSVVFFGLLFCFFLRRTGNLWFPIGFHAGWDWGQTFVYGVPDSGLLPYHSLLRSYFNGPLWLTGGTVGPEASIFTPIALLIAALIFDRLYRETRYCPET